FGITFRLDYYEDGELATIVRRSAGILGVEIAADAADEISGRARGTPRVAYRILRRVPDVAEVRHQGAITTAIAREALDLLEVDEEGLERLARALLLAVAEEYGGRPGGGSGRRVGAPGWFSPRPRGPPGTSRTRSITCGSRTCCSSDSSSGL